MIAECVAHISKESNYHYPSVKNKVQDIIDMWILLSLWEN